MLNWKGIWASPKLKVLPSGTLSQTLDLEEFCHSTSTITSAIKLVSSTITASLPTFVYNAIGMMQHQSNINAVLYWIRAQGTALIQCNQPAANISNNTCRTVTMVDPGFWQGNAAVLRAKTPAGDQEQSPWWGPWEWSPKNQSVYKTASSFAYTVKYYTLQGCRSLNKDRLPGLLSPWVCHWSAINNCHACGCLHSQKASPLFASNEQHYSATNACAWIFTTIASK